MQKNDENLLIQAGLSQEQALIYQALLDRGPQRASALSQWVGIKRGLTYKVLEQLEAMGLVQKKGAKGTVATFFPSHPHALIDLIERKEKEVALAKETLTFALGSFASKYNLIAGKPNVQFYEGEAGVRKAMEDCLTSATEILTIADNERMNAKYHELNQTQVLKRKKSGIKRRIISRDTPYIRNLAQHDDPDFTVRRVIKAENDFGTVIQIYDNKISYFTLDDRSIAFIVEDALLYETHRIIFEALWSNAMNVSENQ